MATDKWIRPLGPTETLCHESYDKSDCLTVCYVLRISTVKEITEQDARTVFDRLIRNAPNLRMYVEENDSGELWFREMAEPRLDFEIMPDADPFQEYHNLAQHRYATNGPFWAVRLLPWSPKQTAFVNKTKLDEPQETTKLPFMCHILLASNHAITDGFTSHQVIKLMLNLFDEFLHRKNTDNITEDTITFLDRSEETQIVIEIENEFKNNIRSLKDRNESINKVVTHCILPEGYKVPIKDKFETVCLVNNLDKQTTKLFTQRCKKECITFHSGFSAVLDAAYVKLLQDADVQMNSYNITALHCINKRAYFKDGNKFYGNLLGLFDICVDTPKDVCVDFWSYARQIHQMMKDKKTSKAPFELYAIENLTGTNVFQPFEADKVHERSLPPMITYFTSNMLNVTNIFGESVRKFGNIRLDWYDRISTLQVFPTLWMSVYQTYNDQLMHSLQYNAGLMDAQTAQKLSDNIFKIIRHIV